ncbi:MAG: TetR family transcriptional regulator [Actinomycetales bacterium]|nr:TetR family transcriptional regulator [Actinomycetales bacterium]
MTSDTRDRVLQAAGRLFAERGYAGVSIRQIAAESGVSPAMVMKVGGSKAAIFRDATPPEAEPVDREWERQEIGRELVRRIVQRREDGAVEPWLQALLGALDSPDPSQARQEFVDHYVSRLSRRFGGEEARREAELAAGVLIGIAAAIRPLRLLETERDWIIERGGAMIQSLIDEQSG